MSFPGKSNTVLWFESETRVSKLWPQIMAISKVVELLEDKDQM